MKGKLITSCEEMYELALNKRSVSIRYGKLPCPAAFLINWQTCLLIRSINAGYFHVYIKQSKTK